jgi:hypothetical protein
MPFTIQRGVDQPARRRLSICLGNGLEATLYNNLFKSDITIRFQDETSMPGHSLIMSMWSPVIGKMFLRSPSEEGSFTETRTNEMSMKEYDPVAAKLFIKLLYALPRFDSHLLGGKESFDVFDVAMAYQAKEILYMCIDNIKTVILGIQKGEITATDKQYISLIAAIVGRLFPYYDKEAVNPDIFQLLNELVNMTMTAVATNLTNWMKHKGQDLCGALDVKAMAILLKLPMIDVTPSKLFKFYVQWITYHNMEQYTDSKGKKDLRPKRVPTREELELLSLVDWLNIPKEKLVRFYNSVGSHERQSPDRESGLPPAFKEMAMGYLFDVFLYYDCDDHVTTYRFLFKKTMWNQGGMKRPRKQQASGSPSKRQETTPPPPAPDTASA